MYVKFSVFSVVNTLFQILLGLLSNCPVLVSTDNETVRQAVSFVEDAVQVEFAILSSFVSMCCGSRGACTEPCKFEEAH